MKIPLTLTWLVTLLLLLPAALGGSASSPELTDVQGDAKPQLDIISGWFTNDDEQLHVHLQIASLQNVNPLLQDDHAYRYIVNFDVAGGAQATASVHVWSVETSSSGIEGTFVRVGLQDFWGIGTKAQGSNGVTAVVVPADGLVVFSFPLDGLGIGPGSIVTNLAASTHEAESAVLNPLNPNLSPVLGRWAVADTAGPSTASYLVS